MKKGETYIFKENANKTTLEIINRPVEIIKKIKTSMH